MLEHLADLGSLKVFHQVDGRVTVRREPSWLRWYELRAVAVPGVVPDPGQAEKGRHVDESIL
jgi:hypothetical protein